MVYLQWHTNSMSYIFVSNCAIFNNFEQHLTQISRSCQYLMLNISETAKDMAIVAIEDE